MIIADVPVDDGFTPLLCPSVIEVAEVIQQTQPDVVIVDPWVGAETTTASVLDQITLAASMGAIPIIICSADDAFITDHRATWYRSHWQIVPNPFDVDTLLHAVHAAVVPTERLVQTSSVTHSVC